MRIAIRHPLVVSLLAGRQAGTVAIGGLSSPPSVWESSVQPLDTNWRFIELCDLSAQSDVSRAHTDFVANASHELRTPLAAILGYVETLMEPQAGADPATIAIPALLSGKRGECSSLSTISCPCRGSKPSGTIALTIALIFTSDAECRCRHQCDAIRDRCCHDARNGLACSLAGRCWPIRRNLSATSLRTEFGMAGPASQCPSPFCGMPIPSNSLSATGSGH